MKDLILIGVIIACLSWTLTQVSRWLAKRFHVIKEARRKRDIHKRPIPEWGGIGIGITIMITVVIGMGLGWFPAQIHPTQLVGFLVGIFLLLVVGALDDRYDISPAIRFPLYALACLVVLGTGTSISQITRLGGHGGIQIGLWGWPLTFLWLFFVTLTMKVLDGLDGLVTGQTIIGAAVIMALALSPAYFQPSVVLLALIVGSAYLGFLPVNFHPAKQFLGESGGTIAGFSLAFLSIVAGAKVATALMVVGLPLVDLSFVVTGRLLRGVSPFQGDDTHLHFRLLKAGWSQRRIVFLLWAIALAFGCVALIVQTKGKILLLLALVGLTIALSSLVSLRQRKRKFP